jgi:transglutaminase-like putative cysteine protease
MKHWLNGVRSSWHHSLALLWLMIIALQWISYTEPFWLEETTATVLTTLAVVALIEIILPVKWVYRLLLEGAAAIYLVYRAILHYGVYIPDPWTPALRDRLPEAAAHMYPYIWFALGAWLLLLISSWWVNGKSRILMFIAMNITAFAALDSFTSSILWQEVAWTVFAGMGWLVTNHLRSFQLHYPRGWTYLLKYPFKVALNIAIIFSLVIIAGVNMPDVRPTLTDPYTAWQEWNGNGISSGSSTSGSGESASGESSVNRTTSGYSLDDDNLGGGFNFDYSPVMTVTSDLRTYMRGEIRSEYSGKGWSDDDSVSRGPHNEVQVGEPLERSAAPKTETRTLKQTVKLLGGNSYPVLFGGYSISAVDSLDGEVQGSGLSWRSTDSELLWNPEGSTRAYPQTYVVTSEVPVVPVQELSKQTFEQLYGAADVDAQYLQLPDNFPQRVSALAEEITAEAQTPYEKVMLLQQYLQQTFPYTNQPDVSRAKSKDMVESFLFEIMEGYCDYYSTALVTMARSLDIPARWVKGYAPGEQAEIPDNLALQQGGLLNNNYTITNADAHSWAEIYFGDYGWVPVEATPGFNVPVLTQSEENTPEEPAVQEEEQPEPDQAAADAAGKNDGFDPGVWVVSGAAAILLLWSGYLLWQRRMSLRFLIARLRSGHELTPVQKVLAETQRWVRYARRKGMLKKEHETLRESVERWSRERPAAAGNFAALLAMFERANYSPEVIADKDWLSVYTEALRLRKSMKSVK